MIQYESVYSYSRRRALQRRAAETQVPKEEEEEERLKNLERKETEYMRLQSRRVGIDGFEQLTHIGKEAFGEVRRCRAKSTGEIFAMTKLKKSEMLSGGQVEYVRSERNLLAEVDRRYIVELFCSFQGSDYLYLIMEYLPGGDVVTLLMRKDILSEDVGRFYIAESILAIHSIHLRNYVHRLNLDGSDLSILHLMLTFFSRDIKPDKLILDRNGHLKLSDFGLCKPLENIYSTILLEDESFNTQEPIAEADPFCDKSPWLTLLSLDYMAPEILLEKGYGMECDWWSLGAILSEMLIGYPPFCSDDPRMTCCKIINWRSCLKFPDKPKISPEARDLICRFLCNVEARLGTQGVEEIKVTPLNN
ncbi:Protein kinase domain [Dillenia turbinata]|uniref:non-specific serine/threonine protein kinase n=1 Tax=Dillenia turbinata TaxID=194707 RepID=A0AAN8W0S9_9MAGN